MFRLTLSAIMSPGNKLASGTSLISVAPSSKSVFLLLISIFSWIFLVAEVNGASLENGGGISSSSSSSKPTDLLSPSSSPSVRAKRSRAGEQQLCGYRLLDALRSVCDRNFVGFTRRSDPSLFLQGGGPNEGQSGEEMGSNGGSPWDSINMETPMYNGQPAPALQENGLNFNWDDLEFSQPGASGFVSNTPTLFWPPRLTSSSGGTKGFALKLLAEPPAVHQRFRRNIIDECCKKPCAINQMLKYCAITAGKRSF
ncbi:Bombyxin C-1 [Orchesella cincta]|uniref:Bombyxin C-1 n=1 Tax=Orchesella cincta TaxID=48709 RepID=A0A1D2MUC7_ORCCI|nr:Bombyxin C-1 [Orchesella cincta]